MRLMYKVSVEFINKTATVRSKYRAYCRYFAKSWV